MMKTVTMTMLALAMMPLSATAQDTAEDHRYTLERLDNGVVRLDTKTGAMSLCKEKEGNLICRMAADERAAYEEQLDLLEKRVAALEARPGTNSALSSRQNDLPSDEEVDRSIGIMERFMRSFFGMVKEFEGEKNHAGRGQAEPGQL